MIRKKEVCRTPRVNLFFNLINLFSISLNQKEKGLNPLLSDKSPLVVQTLQKSNFLQIDIEAIINF